MKKPKTIFIPTWKQHVALVNEGKIKGTKDILDLFGFQHPDGVFCVESMKYNAIANSYWSMLQVMTKLENEKQEYKRIAEGRMF